MSVRSTWALVVIGLSAPVALEARAGSVLPDGTVVCGDKEPCASTARPGFSLPDDGARLSRPNAQPNHETQQSGDAALALHQKAIQRAIDAGRADKTTSAAKPAPINTEKMSDAASRANRDCGATPTAAMPFRVSIDGKPAGPVGRNDADSQRCTDLALARADIQIRYDGMRADRRLNVLAAPDAALKGHAVAFATHSTYAFWLARAEILILPKDASSLGVPIAVLPVTRGGATWHIPEGAPAEVRYVLRVYDVQGRFDETKPKSLSIADLRGSHHRAADLYGVYEGNALGVTNIPVSGGTVTVSGRGIAPGHRVYVMGMPVPVDAKGDFATRQVLSPGPHQVEVSIRDGKGVVSEFSRSATIPDNDHFYVAMADITAGHNNSRGASNIVKPENETQYEDKGYVNGRAAFYFKGLIKGEYLLTASADTKDQPLRSIFSNLDAKDPRYLLRSLDPNRYYPVYGDDSTLVEDAPTRGKFYVRLEKGDSSILWGNFKTTINGTEFVRYDRGLYGAHAKVVSDDSTKFGERRGKVEGFAAEPGTIGARDVLRGTGGSLYYLRRQGIAQGSERISVEVRDRVTGLVLRNKILVPTEDYEINYLQGRVILRNPLSSSAEGDLLIQNGTGGSGAEQYLVVTYEYAPNWEQTSDRVVGGRASYWVNDHLQVGVTGYDQTMPGEKLQIMGSDVTLRYKPGTYVKLEGARSNGPGSGEDYSIDGGFTFDHRGTNGERAYAKRIEAAADLADIFENAKGRIAGFYSERDAGFSGPGALTIDKGNRDGGVLVQTSLGRDWLLKAKGDFKDDQYRDYKGVEANIGYRMAEQWKLTFGARSDDNNPHTTSASSVLNQSGSRTDAAVRVDYDSLADWTVYGYIQATLERSGERDPNNRVGVGGTARITEKLVARGEVSIGDGGFGAKAGTEYKIDERQTAYMNYILDPDRTDIMSRGGEGVLVSGARTRFGDNASVFAEERLRHGGGYSGLTHAYGLDFVPYANWRAGVGAEWGDLHDPVAGDVKRIAVSTSIGYAHAGLTYSGKFEYRNDKIDSLAAGHSERDTYLTRNTVGVKVSDDWRFIGRLNGSYSEGSLGTFYDGRYLEAVTGLAYRPINNDRLNMLFKYTYFYDLPSPGQLTLGGSIADYAQQSHILSVDASYDVTAWLNVGGKYAYRTGDLRDNRTGGPWFESQAHLLIGRIDLRIVKEWDVLGELRLLDVPTADDRRFGALVAVYRHINDNIKMGVGYNFTDFSDDLTHLNYDRRGFFVNALAKY